MATVTVVLSRKELKEADYVATTAREATPAYGISVELEEELCRTAIEVLASLFRRTRESDEAIHHKGDD